ncbi:CDK5 regulatory subunit-associated protein 3 isoform X2 [Belonocnema kinseyi]|uniref:CDK5 regulatory subunit-associated protein 3 isoform X2 n=1 Tax=Belonocnema kinseyi TaxID=2817044 RepID=UPI00143CD71A|nr:CDK5 regulatory subunit-associated protein 3 isoform X2 [Belonocnema kinseyi]
MEEQDIPIDINSGKLLEWLTNRRHCNKDWQTNILTIREKINTAIQDMPVHEEIAKLLSGTHINFFHCKKIVEILKETEADTKNLFGRYGSQRMKDWQEIVKLYEKDNLYLAEASQMLIRNINFEVPGFKKQIQKLEQMQNELEKKEVDYKKSENLAHSEFNMICKQLGISGNQIKKELVERVKELPDIYQSVAKKTKSIGNVVEFYNAFVEYTLGRSHNGGCVPIVNYVIEKGNTTTYEWTYGEAPLSIVESPLDISLDDDERQFDDTIDFGDNSVEGVNISGLDLNDTIDFGDVSLEEGEIDWGDVNIDQIVEGEIDYNISLESGIVVEADGNDGGVATGKEALTILDNPSTRNDFIDQLFELEAFLKLRLYEFKGDNSKNLLSMSQMQEASSILQLATLDSTQNMLDNVQIILSEILDSRVQHLHNIKHSPRYVDALTATLKQKLALVEKMKSLQTVTREKRDVTRKQVLEIQPVLKLVIQRTRELQNEIEKDISKKYKNRIVHLTGGVNTL